jgi:O-antigen ligase
MIFPKENAYAENSILLRTVNIEAVRADSGYSPFIGAGYAVNGNAVVGDDNTNSIPLDSMYIYMLSNYGNLGIIFLVIVASLILGILYQRTRRGLNPSVYLYWMISLSMNFVYNNPLTNYPGYIFPIIISILLLSVRKPEGSIAKRSEKTLGRVHRSH